MSLMKILAALFAGKHLTRQSQDEITKRVW